MSESKNALYQNATKINSEFVTEANSKNSNGDNQKINPIFYSLYAIIEWHESVRKTYGRFEVIPAIEVMGITNNSLNTGDIVYVKKNLRAVLATIIVLSGKFSKKYSLFF
jgi:hypothetical protein